MPRSRSKVVRSNVRRLALAVAATAAVVACGAAVAMAVTPQGGVLLQGKTSHNNASVRLKVAGSGRQVAKIQFPGCDGAGPPPVLKKLKISAAGNFSAKRNGRDVVEQARQGSGGSGLYDEVYDWKVSVNGKFTAPTKAQGTLSVSYRSFLRDSETGEIRDEPGIPQYRNCKTGKVTWKAKQAP
jgi:hypothetical protein